MAAASPAQQVDDWNRRMAPMADVVVTEIGGHQHPATLAGQAFLICETAAVATRITVAGGLAAQLPVPLDCVRPMTDADRVRFGLGSGAT